MSVHQQTNDKKRTGYGCDCKGTRSGRKPGREDKSVQSEKKNKDGSDSSGVCICPDQQLPVGGTADLYKPTDIATL